MKWIHVLLCKQLGIRLVIVPQSILCHCLFFFQWVQWASQCLCWEEAFLQSICSLVKSGHDIIHFFFAKLTPTVTVCLFLLNRVRVFNISHCKWEYRRSFVDPDPVIFRRRGRGRGRRVWSYLWAVVEVFWGSTLSIYTIVSSCLHRTQRANRGSGREGRGHT